MSNPYPALPQPATRRAASLRRLAACCLTILMVSTSALSQSITGPTCIVGGTYAGPYTINGVSWSTADKWCVSGGTVDPTGSSCANNPGTPSIGIDWQAGPTTGTISYYHPATAPTPIATLTVSLLTPGGMTGPNPPLFPYNTPITATFNSTNPAVGCGGYTIGYQWQQQLPDNSWQDISGATGINLTISGVSYTQSTNIRRAALFTNGPSGRVYSGTWPILVPTPGTVTPATQTVNANGTPTALTSTAASNCMGAYNYLWWSSPDNIHWQQASGTALTWTPPTPSVNMYYRLGCTCTQNNSTVYTGSVLINVVAPLISGTVSPTYQAINPNTMTDPLTSTVSSGGNGSYTYVWQSSPDGSTNWQGVTGGTGQGTLTYSPGIIGSTTWFRMATVSNGGTVYSNPSQVFVSTSTVYGVTAPNNPVGTGDNNLNWIITSTYNDQGNLLGQNKQFFDYEGALLQTQNKVFYRNNNTGNVYSHVLATQPIPDASGRPVATTLPAPIDYGDFSYRPHFVQATNGTDYSYKDFDLFNPSGTQTDNTLQPLAVGGQSVRGTLGWYYSPSNYWEPYTPTTGYPYTRKTYYQDGTGNVKLNGGAGETFHMGAGHEIGTFVTPVTGELANYLAVRNKFFTTGQMGSLPSGLLNGALVTVGKDANGSEGISITDRAGNILMAARPGTDLVANNLVSVTAVPANFTQQVTCVTGNNVQLTSITGGALLNAYLVSATGAISLAYSGSATGFPTTVLGNGTVILVSDAAFTAGYISGGTTYTGPSTTEPASTLPAFGFFKILADQTPVTITGGGYTLYNMYSEAPTGLNPNGTLDRGYYKVVATSGIVNVSYNNSFTDVYYRFYNSLNQLVAEIEPNGVKLLETGLSGYATLSTVPFVMTYTYDAQGRLVTRVSPDEGTRTYVFRADGKIRFSQNALQAGSGAYSYTNYDAFGRIIETGQYQPDGSGVQYNTVGSILENTSSGGGLTTGTKTDVVMTMYDVPDPSFSYMAYTQDAANMGGAVSTTKRYSTISSSGSTLVSQSWYSYDEEGKVTWQVKYIADLGSSGYKTTEFFYDNMSRLTKKIFQKNTGSETFVHYYSYDDRAGGQLSKIATATSDVGMASATLQATYIYYLHGGLRRIELGTKLQGIDYTYTLQGALKAINNSNPASTADPGGDAVATNGFQPDAFGEVLDYYPSDYKNDRTAGAQTFAGVNTTSLVPAESYAGNIKAMSWYSVKPPNTGSNSPNAYVFNYDPKYQFIGATWGTNLNFGATPATFTTTTFNQEKITVPGSGSPGTPAFDLNGNILNVQRTDNAGNATDQFIYHYDNNNNQLTRIANGPSGSTNYATYAYDVLGRETSETLATSTLNKYYKYDLMGRVTLIAQDAAFNNKIAAFVYDETGSRIEKLSYNTSYQLNQVTYYYEGVVYTAQVINNVVQTATPLEYDVEGSSGRLGTYNPRTPAYVYELRDHLGNVRTVIAATGTAQSSADYYPFGSVIQPPINSYRYGYQGQYSETDPETNLNSFLLRMYNPRIARWSTPDPKQSSFNPYMAMDNDPVNHTDPDGGCPLCDAYDFINKVGADNASLPYQGPNGMWLVNYDGKTYKFKPSWLDRASNKFVQATDAVSRWADRNGFVADASVKATFGAQIGIKGKLWNIVDAKAEAGAQVVDIGNADLNLAHLERSKVDGGEQRMHNFVSVHAKALNKEWLAAGVKYDYTYLYYNSYDGPTMVPGTAVNDWSLSVPLTSGFGPKAKIVEDLVAAQTKVNLSAHGGTGEKKFYGLDIGGGAKLLLGIEFKLKIGFER